MGKQSLTSAASLRRLQSRAMALQAEHWTQIGQCLRSAEDTDATVWQVSVGCLLSCPQEVPGYEVSDTSPPITCDVFFVGAILRSFRLRITPLERGT